MLALIHFCSSEFGWMMDYVLDEISIITALLMVRQKLTVEGKIGLTIADKELIDSNNWDELLKENRRKLAKIN